MPARLREASPHSSSSAIYALLRVPCIERGEGLDAGVILYVWALDHLGAAVHLDLPGWAPSVRPPTRSPSVP
jgi:hypothetical protein